jgi:hypothetical protein
MLQLDGVPVYRMSRPCKRCGGLDGVRDDRNGQACIFCIPCTRESTEEVLVYNAPKAETGEPQTHVKTRPDIKPSQRSRILERDHHRCRECGGGPNDGVLHVGHLVSVDQGKRFGVPDDLLFSDSNLVTTCDACNLGRGSRSWRADEIALLMVAMKIELEVNGRSK